MLTLERYAKVRAAVEARDDLHVVLDREGVLVSEWRAAECRWLGALAAEVAAGRTELASRYIAAFKGATAREEVAPVLYVSPDAAVPGPVLAPSASSADGADSISSRRDEVPNAAAPPVEPPRTPQQPRALPSYLAMRGVTPASRASADGANNISGRRDELQRGAAQPAPPAVSGRMTLQLDDSKLRPLGTLPFPTVPRLTPPTITEVEPESIAQKTTGRAGVPKVAMPPTSRVGTGTLDANESTTELPPAPTVPDCPSLTVEQYAWVTATLKRAQTANLAAALQRLRLTEDSRRRLDALWKGHMARYPAVKQAFISALARHLSEGP